MKKITANRITKYIGSIYEENNNIGTNNIFLGDMRVASITNGTLRFYHSDHLGGTNVVTDETGVKKELLEYKPFGEVDRHDQFGSGPSIAHFYFTGKELDDEVGLYYFGARYYDSSLGRFITADTIVPGASNPQAFNRSSYAGNNPVSHHEDGNGFWKTIGNLVKSFFKAVVQAAAFVVLSATPLGPVGAGALVGAISGGITDNGWSWKGAAIGAGIGAVGGFAFGSTGSNGFLGDLGPSIGLGLLVAGAGYVTATGGLEGLANYGASVAGAIVGVGIGNGINKAISDFRVARAARLTAGTKETFGNSKNTPGKTLNTNPGTQAGQQQVANRGNTPTDDFVRGKIAVECVPEGCGVTAYRKGSFEANTNIKGSQWAPEHPLTTSNYDQKYGLPLENTGKADWVIRGRIQNEYGTGPAPASHNNPANTGGWMEIRPNNPNNVSLDYFHMP